MTFVAGFYSFGIELSDVDRGVYEQFRLKIPRHPEESAQLLCARMLAYALNYTPDLLLTPGLFEIERPMLERKGLQGELLFAADVGAFDVEKFKKLARAHSSPTLKMLTTTAEETGALSTLLTPFDLRWATKIIFEQLPISIVEPLSANLQSSNKLQIMVNEGTLFVSIKETTYEGVVETIDIERVVQEIRL